MGRQLSFKRKSSGGTGGGGASTSTSASQSNESAGHVVSDTPSKPTESSPAPRSMGRQLSFKRKSSSSTGGAGSKQAESDDSSVRATPSKSSEPSPALLRARASLGRIPSFARKSSQLSSNGALNATPPPQPPTLSTGPSGESAASSYAPASMPKAKSPASDEITMALFRAKSLGRQLSFSRRKSRPAANAEADTQAVTPVASHVEQTEGDDEDDDPMFNPDLRTKQGDDATEPAYTPKPLTMLVSPNGHDSDDEIILTPSTEASVRFDASPLLKSSEADDHVRGAELGIKPEDPSGIELLHVAADQNEVQRRLSQHLVKLQLSKHLERRVSLDGDLPEKLGRALTPPKDSMTIPFPSPSPLSKPALEAPLEQKGSLHDVLSQHLERRLSMDASTDSLLARALTPSKDSHSMSERGLDPCHALRPNLYAPDSKKRPFVRICVLVLVGLAALLMATLDVEGAYAVAATKSQALTLHRAYVDAGAASEYTMTWRDPKVVAAGTRLADFTSEELLRWQDDRIDCCPGAVADLVSLMKSHQRLVQNDLIQTRGSKDEL